MKKAENKSWSNLVTLNFESDLYHHLDTKNSDFPIYLLIHALAQVSL